VLKDKKQPLRYNASIVLAEVSGELGDLKAAERFYRVCMEEAAKLQSTQKLLESYGGLIDLLYNNKKFEESAKVCQELLELKTDDGKPRIVLNAVTTRFGDTDFVEDDSFDTARRLKPAVHRLLIQAVAKQKKYDQALQLADTLIKTRDHWLERQLKGWVLREASKYKEAAEVYEDVLDRVTKDRTLEADDKDTYQERYRYILSNIYIDLKDVDKAAKHLDVLLEKHPDDPGYNNDLGYILADNGMQLERAEKLIRKALDLDRTRRKKDPNLKPEDDRDNGAYLDSLGWVLYKQKKFEEAKKYLLLAVEDKDSQHIEIYDHLGDVYIALGDRKQALATWKKGLEFATDSRRDRDRVAIVQKKIEMHSKQQETRN
jgi:tetratricopeptide (TPR) repeat protein